MSLKILKVDNGSKPNDEVVWLKVSTDMNIKGYAVVDKTFDPSGNESNKFRHIFIFPDKQVEEGDFIKLCSGTGQNKSVRNNGGKLNHYFYWHSKECVWNDEGDTARLIEFSVINSKNVPAVD